LRLAIGDAPKTFLEFLETRVLPRYVTGLDDDVIRAVAADGDLFFELETLAEVGSAVDQDQASLARHPLGLGEQHRFDRVRRTHQRNSFTGK
jgi:hypothetical protein